MRSPWWGKTGLAKAVAILFTVLGIAAGLCGLNFVSVILFVPMGGPGVTGPPTLHDRLMSVVASVLSVAAGIELAAIAISLTALIGLGVWSVISSVRSGGK